MWQLCFPVVNLRVNARLVRQSDCLLLRGSCIRISRADLLLLESKVKLFLFQYYHPYKVIVLLIPLAQFTGQFFVVLNEGQL